jgi:hypothetical protein
MTKTVGLAGLRVYNTKVRKSGDNSRNKDILSYTLNSWLSPCWCGLYANTNGESNTNKHQSLQTISSSEIKFFGKEIISKTDRWPVSFFAVYHEDQEVDPEACIRGSGSGKQSASRWIRLGSSDFPKITFLQLILGCHYYLRLVHKKYLFWNIECFLSYFTFYPLKNIIPPLIQVKNKFYWKKVAMGIKISVLLRLFLKGAELLC